MQITFYNRDRRQGNYSFEEIFKNLQNNIDDNIHIKNFIVDSSKNKLKNIWQAKRDQGRVNHITGDVNWLAFGLDPARTILTVHDIGHYENTLEGLKKWLFGLLWWKGPLNRAQYITAISEFTKSKLVEFFGIPPEKVSVIYNPAPEGFKPRKKLFNRKKPRILQVGSMDNKNVEGLMEAVRDMACRVVLLRKPNEVLKQKLIDQHISFEWHSDLNYDQVYDLYCSCDMLYFASTYEGFGMPIVEAQSVGRPVITSNICSMPEVAGQGAHYVDPHNVEEIKKGVIRIIEDGLYRDSIVGMGLENVRRFKATTISRQYLELYQRVINEA